MLTLKKISENTGLQYDKRLKMAFGRYQGYEVSILQTESAAQLLVTFWVKRHDGMPVNPEELWQTSSLDKKIKLNFSYTGHLLRIQMMPKAFSGGVYKHLESFLENFTDELREKQYVNCCNECGAESQLFQCQTGQSTQLLCDTCYANHRRRRLFRKLQVKKVICWLGWSALLSEASLALAFGLLFIKWATYRLYAE